MHHSEEGQTPGSVSVVPARHFGDDEVRRILARAAELQERSDDHPNPRGLTLDELRQIATEAGIDPKFIDQAAHQTAGSLQSRSAAWAGGAHSWELAASVAGEIDDDGRERILHTIRSLMGQKGDLEYVFGRMEWSFDNGIGPVIIGVSSRDGQTEVTVSAAKEQEMQLFHLLGVPFGGLFGGAVASALLGISGPVVVPMMGAAAAGMYGLTRYGWRSRSTFWEGRVREILDRVTAIVHEVAVVPQPTEGPAALPAGTDDGTA